MDHLIIAITSIIAVEALLRLPIKTTINQLWHTSQKATHILLSRHISDHWKEKVILSYAKTNFLATTKLALLIIIFSLLTFTPAMMIDYFQLFVPPITSQLATANGILESTFIATCYYFIREKCA